MSRYLFALGRQVARLRWWVLWSPPPLTKNFVGPCSSTPPPPISLFPEAPAPEAESAAPAMPLLSDDMVPARGWHYAQLPGDQYDGIWTRIRSTIGELPRDSSNHPSAVAVSSRLMTCSGISSSAANSSACCSMSGRVRFTMVASPCSPLPDPGDHARPHPLVDEVGHEPLRVVDVPLGTKLGAVSSGLACTYMSTYS